MTDTYMWQKLRNRFLATEGTYEDLQGIEHPLIAISYDSEGEPVYDNVIEPNDAKTTEDLASSDGIWFEIFPLHSQPYQQELGSTGRNRWTLGLQINVNSPKTFGTFANDTVYDFIAKQFKRGDIFDGIRVLQTAYRSSARLVANAYYSEPVTVMVQADLDI